MHKITVCVGSSCHLKGSPKIVRQLKKLVKDNNLDIDIELGASFCFGRCTDGVIVKFDNQVVSHVTPDNITDIFYEQLREGQ